VIDCAGEGPNDGVGTPIVSIGGALARGSLITSEGVGVEEEQPTKPNTTAIPTLRRPTRFLMAPNLGHGYPRFNWEVPYLWAAIYLEHQPIGQFRTADARDCGLFGIPSCMAP